MATKNDITGDSIASRATTDSYRDGHDRIFGKKKEEKKLRCDDCRAVGALHCSDPEHCGGMKEVEEK